VVGIRHGWKNRIHSLEKSLLRHQAERRQCARFEVVHAESIVHADNDALLSNEGHRYQLSRIILFHPLASRRAAVFLRSSNKTVTLCYTKSKYTNRRRDKNRRIRDAHRKRALR